MRRHCQDPDQHSEQDKRPEQRKRRVHGMEVKVRIARKTVTCRQHETSFERQRLLGVPVFIVPLHAATFQSLTLLWYTIAMSQGVALITGASSGFGLLTSVELAKAGFRVVASMRNTAKRQGLDQAADAALIAERIDVRSLDVTNFSAIPEVVQAVVHDYGRIDVLVNNAGFAVGGFAEDVRLDELRLQFETNFFGAAAMTKAVLPVMRRQHGGHIIQVSSIAGLHGSPSISSYSASKHALEGWTESLRLEVNPLGIKVVLVEPGSFDTGVWMQGAVMAQDAKKSTSPNFERSLRMREAIRKIPKADPIIVARAIAAIAQDPNPKLRYVIGRDARIQLAMKRILPWRWYEHLIAKYLKLE